jgi:hypothetical protein
MALSPNVVMVAPGELITAAHLNNIRSNLDRLDTDKYNKTGGGITGPVVVTAASPQLSLANAAGGGVAALALSSGGSSVGTVQGTASDMTIAAAGSFLDLWVAGASRARLDAANLYVGKTAAAPATTGHELATGGKLVGTIGTASVNQQLTHVSTADANGVSYALYQRTGAVTLGSVAQVSTTGVAFNTTSDKRLKTLTRPVDGAEAVAKVAGMQPVHFTWNEAPGDGEQVGFFAQDLALVAPEAVTEGSGALGDQPDTRTGEGGFVPWMVDPAKLVPTLVAAIQALTARITALEGGYT